MRFSILFIVFFLYYSLQLKAQHVLFGERDLDLDQSSIYFDFEGMCYPKISISDSSLNASDGSLRTWYINHPELLNRLCDSFHIPFIRPKDALINELNDSIIASYTTIFNSSNSLYSSISFFIHGFRKSFKPMGNDVSSKQEFDLLSSALSKTEFPKQKTVNVYWDGLYDCCFSLNHKKNKSLFELFALAAKQAEKVSISFRKVLLQSKFSTINILGHSLGALVGFSACFPEEKTIQTVQSTVKLCLLAPAMGADIIEKRLLSLSKVEQQEYRSHLKLMIVFNENDFVLKKKDNKIGVFGPGVKRYSDTRLGCNYKNCAKRLQSNLLQLEHPFEISLVDKSAIGKCHSMRCYFKDHQLDEVIRFFMEK